ncbi:co-chaperonin GroES [Candidatus Ornithobacterium hominis]|uniref:co-chaperone GroES n=1 Tax=Candidatus Ornithobacterium hominis TaxID=2497989 RepID=UPI000E5B0954|nr:co-chaperone GroES family protein [Candidatus Ornithobacterium hominis]SZD71982.1 co-chaperonin GroES [Candidatus Ornithobacterium hominis]
MEPKVKNLIMVGDRVLVKPAESPEKTKSGLYLPPGVKENEKILKGYVIAVGPGYAIPSIEPEEDWKPESQKTRYIPLQAQENDTVLFLQNATHKIVYREEKYFIVPHNAILMIERDSKFFENEL